MQNSFNTQRGKLYCQGKAVRNLIAKLPTPFYLYSAEEITDRYWLIANAFAPVNPLICYSVKANGNLSILRLLAKQGCGFDIVSQGELFRAKKAGASSEKIVFAGVGKTDEEIAAALKARVYQFNVESESELLRIDELAREMRTHARVALRVNPDVDPKTHRYITTGKRENKFGVDFSRAKEILRRSRKLKNAVVVGVHMHIGSQIVQAKPYLQALDRVEALFGEFPGGYPETIDLGGGFGISYQGGEGIDINALAKSLLPRLEKIGSKLILEPGRFVVAPAGALITKVIATKQSGKRIFVIVDAGMSELIRPSLYEAYHRVIPLEARIGKILADIVGPICESADFFAQDRQFSPVEEGDWIAVLDAGAYGFAMASHYNSRPNVGEYWIQQGKLRCIRRPESFADLVRGE